VKVKGRRQVLYFKALIPDVLTNISQEKTITIPKELLNKLLDGMKEIIGAWNGNAKIVTASKPPKAHNPNYVISIRKHDLSKIGVTTRSRLDK
jgi:hypothetical protein